MLADVVRHGDRGDRGFWFAPFLLILFGLVPVWVRYSERMIFDAEGVEVRDLAFRCHRYRVGRDTVRVKNLRGILFQPNYTVIEFKARGGPTLVIPLATGFAKDRDEIVSLLWGSSKELAQPPE